MLSSSVDFPGLSRLRSMGQRMMRMRQQGMMGNPDNPTGSMMPGFNPMLSAPQNQPYGQFSGGGEAGQDIALQTGGEEQPKVPELNPQPIPPPAVSSIRDVKPGGGLGSFRNMGMRAGRRGMM